MSILSNKTLLGAQDNNRVYYKESGVDYITITNTFDSVIESKVHALGDNAEVFIKDEYDKFSSFLDDDYNIFDKNKAVFGYWFNGNTLTHTSENRYIYGYINVEGKEEIYLQHNSPIYKTFNIAFYDRSYSLIKVVANTTYYSMKDDVDLASAKMIIIGSAANWPTGALSSPTKREITSTQWKAGKRNALPANIQIRKTRILTLSCHA